MAAVIKAVMAARGTGKAEVLLPAYTCPELVSATLFAGADPVLVDLEPKRPWLNLTELEKKISADTAAIIAVNLFGIPERFDRLKALTKHRGITLIEDSAQYFPASANAIRWQGDLTILSFGRGKPVSLLGGGAVICSDNSISHYLPSNETEGGGAGFTADKLFQLKATMYNLLLSPRFYWLPESLPFLHLGETVYHPMDSIKAFPSGRLAYLPPNLKAYWDRHRHSGGRTDRIFSQLTHGEWTDLPAICCGNELPPLIRYPFLAANKKQANRIYSRSKRHGLGVTRMYKKPLNEIEGLEHVFAGQGPFPNAKEFADLLLTFPTHRGVPENFAEVFNKTLRIDTGI